MRIESAICLRNCFSFGLYLLCECSSRLHEESGNFDSGSSKIKKGEGITHDYICASIGGPSQNRRSLLLEKYGFFCRCIGCIKDLVMSGVHSRQIGFTLEEMRRFEVKTVGIRVFNQPSKAALAKLDQANG